MDLRPVIGLGSSAWCPRPEAMRHLESPWRPPRRHRIGQAALSLAVIAAALGLPTLALVHALRAHDHEHDAGHNGVAAQALIRRVPVTVGTGTASAREALVLRTLPSMDDDAAPRGVDEPER